MTFTKLARKQRLLRAALACLVGIGFADFAAAAAAQTYRVDPEQTTAGFAVSHLGIVRQRGHFDRAWGTIVIDPAGGAGGSIDVVIDPSSIDTGWNLRDDFLRSEDMFDVTRYPVVRFRSTHLEYRDGRIVAAEGDITLHGVTRSLRLNVERLACGRNPADGREGCGATVTGRLLRREFGMEFAWPLVGDDVDLDFAITAFRVRDEGETDAP
jgi:polyisoprenoid-binding protein YceI